MLTLFRQVLRTEVGMRAWVQQRGKSYVVHWHEPDGTRKQKSCGDGVEGKALAKKYQNLIHSQLVLETYKKEDYRPWSEFRKEYEATVAVLKAPKTQVEIKSALDTFERLAKPETLQDVTALLIDKFAVARAAENSQRRQGKVSRATVNKELRHVKAAMRKAKAWKMIADAPEVTPLRESKKIPGYVIPDHFDRLHAAADVATMPHNYDAPAWWRGLMITAYMTGLRIKQLLRLRVEDYNDGLLLCRAEDAKGNRDTIKPVHPLVQQHLAPLAFGEFFFPWPHHLRTLYVEWHRLCDEAGVPHYGFHDLRRGFASLNADRMTGDALQSWMEHQDYKTTQRYVNVARQLRPAMENLFVPRLAYAPSEPAAPRKIG